MYLDYEEQYESCVLFSASSENAYYKGTSKLNVAVLVAQLMKWERPQPTERTHVAGSPCTATFTKYPLCTK
jgi:hypothetical protein